MKNKFTKVTFIFIFLLSLVTAYKSAAYQYSARMTFGTFVSLEKHPADGQNDVNNDFAVSSARFYYQARKNKYVIVSDLRDKHDFFDKLEKEKQQLTAKNTFQIRKLYFAKQQQNKGLQYKVGRFSVDSMGAAFFDGGQVDYRLSRNMKFGLAGGLNPKLLDKSYVEYNANTNAIGAYYNFTKKYQEMVKNLTFDLAFVQQSYLSEVDRQYIYLNNMYQWNDLSYLWAFAYYDLVPTKKLQNGNVTVSQKILKRSRLLASANRIDAIEYRRVQDIRETLSSSPYSELRLRYDNYFKSGQQVTLQKINGTRSADNLTKDAIRIGYRIPKLFNRYTDFSTTLISKNQFNKDSLWLHGTFGYFRKKWELDTTIEVGEEKQTDQVTVLKPVIVDLSGGYFWNRNLLFSGNLQYTTDSKVNIISTYFKVSYRFGNQSTPPLRDGAAPRGTL